MIGPWDVRAFKELFRHVQRRPDVPGDEVHIAAVESGGSAGEGDHLRAVPGGEHFFQFVPEVKNLLRSFLLPQGERLGQRVDGEHGRRVEHRVVGHVRAVVDPQIPGE